MKLAKGDRVEVFIKEDGRLFQFEVGLVHVDTKLAYIKWERGWVATPYLIANFDLPASLEGQKLYSLHFADYFNQAGYGWGKILRKIEPTMGTAQLRLKEPGGMFCAACNKMIQYASANMSDGSFCCRDCRQYKSWKLPDGITFVGYDGERN
jgi:hypothetical protein